MEEVIVDSIPRIQPITIKTPILELEADYGNPYIDFTMVISIVAIFYIGKKLVDRWMKTK